MLQLLTLFILLGFSTIIAYSMRDKEFERNKKEEQMLGLDHDEEERMRQSRAQVYKNNPEELEKWRNEQKEMRKSMLVNKIISEMTEKEFKEYEKNKKGKL